MGQHSVAGGLDQLRSQFSSIIKYATAPRPVKLCRRITQYLVRFVGPAETETEAERIVLHFLRKQIDF